MAELIAGGCSPRTIGIRNGLEHIVIEFGLCDHILIVAARPIVLVRHRDGGNIHLVGIHRGEGDVAGDLDGLAGLNDIRAVSRPVAELLALGGSQPCVAKGQHTCVSTQGIPGNLIVRTTPLAGSIRHRIGVATPTGIEGHVAFQGGTEGVARVARPALGVPAEEITLGMMGSCGRCRYNIGESFLIQHFAEGPRQSFKTSILIRGVVRGHGNRRRHPFAIDSQVAVAHGHISRYFLGTLGVQIPAREVVTLLAGRSRGGLRALQGLANELLVLYLYALAVSLGAIHIEVDGIAVAGVVELGAVVIHTPLAIIIRMPPGGILILGKPGKLVEIFRSCG